jgi:hypothetical protein
MGKTVHLRHPEHEGLSFGPNNEIQFGLKAGFAPGEVFVDVDHPLYQKLRELEPTLVEVTASGQTTVFGCPIHQDKVFATNLGLLNHMRSKGHAALVAVEAAKTKDDTPKGQPPRGTTVGDPEAQPPEA